jgi:hypothetical protein
VREICTHGSEGGGPGLTGPPYPYHIEFGLDLTDRAGTARRLTWPWNASDNSLWFSSSLGD